VVELKAVARALHAWARASAAAAAADRQRAAAVLRAELDAHADRLARSEETGGGARAQLDALRRRHAHVLDEARCGTRGPKKREFVSARISSLAFRSVLASFYKTESLAQ